MTASSSSAGAPMAAERNEAEGENEERMSSGTPRERYPLTCQRRAAARQTHRCVAAPEYAAATSCCPLAGEEDDRKKLGRAR